MEMISDREHILLAVIDRLRIIRATDAAWLAGYTDYTYCRKCLRKLCDMGLLQICRDSAGSNCYYLSGRGLAVLGKQTSHTYEVSATTHHALVVGRVCAWLRRTEGASPGELLTDSVLRSKGDKSPASIRDLTATPAARVHKAMHRSFVTSTTEKSSTASVPPPTRFPCWKRTSGTTTVINNRYGLRRTIDRVSPEI